MMQDDLMLKIQTRTLIHHHQNVSCQVSLTPKSHHRPQTQMMCCASFKYVSCHRLWLSRIIYCCLSWPFFHRRCVSFVTIFSNATILIIGWKKKLCLSLFSLPFQWQSARNRCWPISYAWYSHHSSQKPHLHWLQVIPNMFIHISRFNFIQYNKIDITF